MKHLCECWVLASEGGLGEYFPPTAGYSLTPTAAATPLSLTGRGESTDGLAPLRCRNGEGAGG